MMANMYSCIFMKRIFYLYKISIKSPISEIEADMLLTQSIYRLTYNEHRGS